MKNLNVPIDDKVMVESKVAAARAEMPLRAWVELAMRNQLLAADGVAATKIQPPAQPRFDPAAEVATLMQTRTIDTAGATRIVAPRRSWRDEDFSDRLALAQRIGRSLPTGWDSWPRPDQVAWLDKECPL